jgi:hypothetical protein
MSEQLTGKALDDMLRKIRNLMANADDAANEEACAMFAKKASELMTKYGLEEAHLEVEEQSGIDQEDVNVSWSASPARKAMVVAVCALYMVRPLTHSGSKAAKKHWTLVGRKANVFMAKEMAEYLLKATMRLSNEYARKTGGNNIDFRRGCFMRLAERLFELKQQQERESAPKFNSKGNPENLPALRVYENDLIEKYLAEKFGRLRASRRSRVRYGVDGMMGRQAADGIGLNKQVGSGARNGFQLPKPK